MAIADDCDTVAALPEYHASRAGIRGLIESGVTTVPPFFLAPASPRTTPALDTFFAIPTVDLSLPRSATVPLVGAAARTCGIFHVTNHGVQADALVSAVRAFHELPLAVRSELYTLTPVGGVTYCTVPYAFGHNPVGLLLWRDFLRVSLGPQAPDLGHIPAACREGLVESYRCLEEFAKEIAGMLSEALDVGASRLQHVEGWAMAGNYYPPCPEPARVEGSTVHTDPCFFTVLAQDHIGGLQVRLNDGDIDGQWVDVPPMPGALLVNIGDVLKLVSNDEYHSMEHRVTIKSSEDARVSGAVFYNPTCFSDSDLFGPFPELITAEKPARYRSFTMEEFMDSRTKFGHGRSVTDHFKVADECSD